jgi:LuxR family transcriptional regulator, maltose regulon positive regulatory protein
MSLAVKSGRPVSQPGSIPRQGLLERLRAVDGSQTVLVVAPAGYGKTTLLAQWAASRELARQGAQSAWVALEPWHDDPLALMRELVGALQPIEPFPPRLLERLAEAAEPGAAMRLLPALAGAMEARRRPALLVLDELHALRSTTALQVVATLAEHLPACVRLALAARARPQLPLGRLRAHRALVELGARELAMSAREAAALLAGLGVELDARATERLMQRSEGWPAALYLAALALREQPDPAAALNGFSGRDELLAEFLRDELLSDLDAAERELLVQSSVCEVLSADLCDALIAGRRREAARSARREGSAQLLERLARGPLAFEAVDSAHERYRCHPLLREALQAELARRAAQAGRASLAGAHARARAWHAAHGETDAAIEHAIAAGEADAAGQLMWEHLPGYIPVGRNDVLQAHLRELSEEQIAASPTLALTAAHSALSLGELRRAERYALAGAAALARAPARSKPSSLRAGIAAIEAAVARDGLAPMASEAARAHRAEDEHSPWQPTFSLLLGVSAHLTGERRLAREHLREGARHGAVDSPSIGMLCLDQLALLSAEEGDVERAAEEAAAAAAEMERHSLGAYPIAALTYAVRADLLARTSCVDEAKRAAAAAARLLERLGEFIPWYGAQTRIALARAVVHLGEIAEARALLAQASRLARRVPDGIVLAGWLEQVWAQVDSATATRLPGSAALTMAELRVLRFLPSHLSFPAIGAQLGVSTNTIKTQSHAVYRKLGAASRSQAVERAREIGLLVL